MDHIHETDHYEILECQECGAISMRHRHASSEDFFTDEAGETEYIERSTLFPPRSLRDTALAPAYELPHPIQPLYLEASSGLDAGLTHLVALALSPLLEATLKDQGTTGRTTFDRINAAVGKGLITTSEAEILHKIRDIRNAADHEAEVPLPEAIAASFEVIERLLHRLYVAPNVINRLKRPREL
jgi:hypothetical protein